MSKKVTYVDAEGSKFEAEITGPIASIRKHVYEKDGGGVLRVKKQGEVLTKIGEQEIKGATERDNRTKPYVNLTVNFGSVEHPRFAEVTGVRLEKDLENRRNKAFYIPIEEEKPKTEKK